MASPSGAAAGVAGRGRPRCAAAQRPSSAAAAAAHRAPSFDNKLLIQADPQHYQSILKMLEELDQPPRQILLDAKIYSVDLTDQFASGMAAYFQSNAAATTLRHFGLAPTGFSRRRDRDAHRRDAGQHRAANCWAP